MGDANNQDEKKSDVLRTVIISVICIPLIIWLLYNAYHKTQESPLLTTACSSRCTAQGYPGYDFKWPMLSSPQCTCIGSPQQLSRP